MAEVLARPARFEDVELPIYPELKKMILERNWVGGEAGGTLKFAYAYYGIPPFAMLDLSEDQIADMEFSNSYHPMDHPPPKPPFRPGEDDPGCVRQQHLHPSV